MPFRYNPITGELDVVLGPGGGGTASTQFDADSGSAVPTALGVITLSGSTGITTGAAGNTVSFMVSDDVPTTFTTDGSNAVATGNTLAIEGAGGIVTSGSGPTVTIDGSALGDVTGPGSSTDNALVRWDGATGQLVQNSVVTLTDAGALDGITTATISTAVIVPAMTAPAGFNMNINAATGFNYNTNLGDDVGANVFNINNNSGTAQMTVNSLGVITLATWNGDTVTEVYGGTNQSTYTQGDILYASAANTLSKLPAASDGQVLTLASGVPSWATPTVGTVTSVSGTANRITSTGGATPVIDIAATYVGQTSLTTLGTVTTGTWNGTAVAEAYGGTNQTTYAQGDILYASAANTLSKLSAGSDDEVLTLASGVPTWAAAGGGGAWSLISTSTASSSASISFTGLSSTYYAYKIVITDLQPATDGVEFYMRTSTNNGSSYDSGSSDYDSAGLRSSDLNISEYGFTAAQIYLHHDLLDLSNASNEENSWEIMLYNPSATHYTQMTYAAAVVEDNSRFWYCSGSGMRNSAADVDAIQFLMSSGNISTGTFKLYGLTAS